MRLMSCILIGSKKLKAWRHTEKNDNEEHSYGNSFKKDSRWSDQPQLEKNLMLSKQPLYQVMENLNKSKIMYEKG